MTLTVPELLTMSLALHRQARPQGRSMNRPKNWRELLKQACDLRKQALEMDPERKEQAWKDEEAQTATGRNTHEALMSFYADQGFLNG
jgi:hypothetical protein